MVRIVRMISAIVLLVLLIQYPIVTVGFNGRFINREVDLTYPVLALIAVDGVIGEMFDQGVSSGLTKLFENKENLLEEISRIQDQRQFTELNLLAFVLLLTLAVFVVPTIGVFMSFFTRWGFALVAVGMGVISAVIFNISGSYAEITITPYFYGIWGTLFLGIIAGGGSDKKKKRVPNSIIPLFSKLSAQDLQQGVP